MGTVMRHACLDMEAGPSEADCTAELGENEEKFDGDDTFANT
jgi:hypothetical protein